MSAARAVDVVRALLADYRFSGVATVAPLLDLPPAVRDRICALAEAGEFLLDLDAEDFDLLAAGGVLPATVVRQVGAAQFPREPRHTERGSLGSLVPLYALMLEALEVRWLRREPVHVVLLLHLVAEYLPLLAWENVLGHAGDPRDLVAFVGTSGSLWGQRGSCDHTAAQRSAAQRVPHAMRGDLVGWTGYLDRFHSRIADALGRCASHPMPGRPSLDGTCRTPCAVWTQLEPGVQVELSARVHLARMYAASPAVALRHHAPVGHFFGVPAPSEIIDAWNRTWDRLARPWPSGDNPLATLPESAAPADGALPGMAALVSAVAGRDVRSGGVLTTIRDAIALELDPEVR